MHLPNKQSDELMNLAINLRELIDPLLAQLPPSGADISIAPSQDLLKDQSAADLFLIREGQVEYRLDGKVITYFEEGDLLGLPGPMNLPAGRYSCELPVTLVPYRQADLLAHVNNESGLQKHWSHYLLCTIAFYQHALAQELRAEFQPSAGFLYFRSGETIIQQGARADRVFTLLEGKADAVCDGVKVGEVNAGEIFGALAVFTRQPRMASVVATNDCTVLAVRKDEFIDLIDHQPQICLGLIEEMAAKINQLNNQLLNQHGKSE